MSLRATIRTLCVLFGLALVLMAQAFPKAEALPLLPEDLVAYPEAAEASFSAISERAEVTTPTPYFSGHWGTPTDPTVFAQDLGCFEDEVIVIVIADVLPDNGKPPNVDWGPKGLTGSMACVAKDDYDWSGS